jgi:drug/metabolite transporter (DMT)-like permease
VTSRAKTANTATIVVRASASEPAGLRAPAWQVWSGLGIVYVVWGSTYLAIRVVVEDLPAMLSGGARFFLAGLIMLAIVAVRVKRSVLTSVTWRQFGWAAFCGSALAAGGNGLVMVAEQSIASGLAALIVAMVPLWVVLMRRASGERIARVTLFGVVVGFCGVALLLLPGGGGHSEPLGFFLVVIASLSWATGSFASSRVTLPSNPFLSTALQMMCGGLLMLVVGVVAGETADLHSGAFDTDAVLAWAYLIVFGSLLAFTAYVWLLQNAPISKVATYAYVNPVIAICLGALILSEDITLTILAGAIIIVGSVAAIVRQESG